MSAAIGHRRKTKPKHSSRSNRRRVRAHGRIPPSIFYRRLEAPLAASWAASVVRWLEWVLVAYLGLWAALVSVALLVKLYDNWSTVREALKHRHRPDKP